MELVVNFSCCFGGHNHVSDMIKAAADNMVLARGGQTE